MRGHVCRRGIAVLTLVLGSTFLAAPARADTPAPVRRSALTTVSPSTLKALRVEGGVAARRQQSGTTSAPSFFKSKKGAVAISLMAAGAGFTVWSINHDREPVKSPVR